MNEKPDSHEQRACSQANENQAEGYPIGFYLRA